jgi:hypothetical protein
MLKAREGFCTQIFMVHCIMILFSDSCVSFFIITATPPLLHNSARALPVVRADMLLIFNLHVFKVFCKAMYKTVAFVVSLKGSKAAYSSICVTFFSVPQMKMAIWAVSVASVLSSMTTE